MTEITTTIPASTPSAIVSIIRGFLSLARNSLMVRVIRSRSGKDVEMDKRTTRAVAASAAVAAGGAVAAGKVVHELVADRAERQRGRRFRLRPGRRQAAGVT